MQFTVNKQDPRGKTQNAGGSHQVRQHVVQEGTADAVKSKVDKNAEFIQHF